MSEPQKEQTPKSEPKPVPKQKFWTTKRITIIAAALFITIGLFLHVRHPIFTIATILIVIGVILCVIILRR